MRRILVLTATLALSAPGLAAAQTEPAPEPEPAPEIRYKAVTDIDFETRRVDAAMMSPAQAYLLALGKREKAPLITLKTDFDEEMKRSADQVR